jgi:hypothetical protein
MHPPSPIDGPLEVDEKFSLETGEMQEWGQGDDPRMLPPPLGERGGHPHNLSKRMESDRISTEQFFKEKRPGHHPFI